MSEKEKNCPFPIGSTFGAPRFDVSAKRVNELENLINELAPSEEHLATLIDQVANLARGIAIRTALEEGRETISSAEVTFTHEKMANRVADLFDNYRVEHGTLPDSVAHAHLSEFEYKIFEEVKNDRSKLLWKYSVEKDFSEDLAMCLGLRPYGRTKRNLEPVVARAWAAYACKQYFSNKEEK